MIKKLLIISIVIILICSTVTISDDTQKENFDSKGSILYVGGTGAGNYSTIQTAINDASDGDTVFVYNGTYGEQLFITKQINLIGENKTNTILDNNFYRMIFFISDYIYFKGFTLQNGGYGINVSTSNNTIENNIMINVATGILIQNSNNNNILNNTILNNNDNGIEILYSYNNTINGNYVLENQDNGIKLRYSNDNTILDNIVSNSHDNIDIRYSNNNTLQGNNISNGEEYGIFLKYSNNNTIIDNNVSDTIYIYGIGLVSSCNNSIKNNFVYSNGDSGIGIIQYSTNNIVSGNDASSSPSGISIGGANYNIISGNNVHSNSNCGINVGTSNFNTIIKNNVHHNPFTIGLYQSCNNTFICNNIHSNTFGFYIIESSNNNSIYLNNFYNNSNRDVVDSFNNIYYSSTLKMGNFWKRYSGNDNNNDGIGDTPYNILGVNKKDFYPLMNHIGFIYEPSEGWNFISLPINFSTNVSNIILSFNDSILSFQEAVNEGLISPYLFGWNRTTQSYEFANKFKPGYGCWSYVYEPCEIWFQYDSTFSDSYITELKTNWNIVSIPGFLNIEKTDLLVDNVPWDTAVSNGWISDYVFGWNELGQSYEFSDVFEPGNAYWLYANQQCVLKRNI